MTQVPPTGRTLVVTTTFPQWEGDPRGAFIRTFWEQKAADGFAIRVLAPHTAWVRGTLRTPLDVTRFAYAPPRACTLSGNFGILENIRARPWRAGLIAPFWLALRHAIRRQLDEGFDFVVGHMLLPAGWEVARACHHRGIPFSLYGHGTDVDLLMRLPGPLRAVFGRRVQQATAIYFPSADKRARYRAAMSSPLGAATGQVPLRIESMVHCVPPPSQTPTAGSTRGSNVLYLGRLTRQKAVDDLLCAIAMMEPMPRVDIAGDGPQRRRLQRLARRLGVPAHFHGFVSGPHKQALLDESGVLCVPSRELPGGFSEGSPLVVREALQSGLPVVATRVGGIPEMAVDHPQVKLVAPCAPPLLARALRDALDRRTVPAASNVVAETG